MPAFFLPIEYFRNCGEGVNSLHQKLHSGEEIDIGEMIGSFNDLSAKNFTMKNFVLWLKNLTPDVTYVENEVILHDTQNQLSEIKFKLRELLAASFCNDTPRDIFLFLLETAFSNSNTTPEESLEKTVKQFTTAVYRVLSLKHSLDLSPRIFKHSMVQESGLKLKHLLSAYYDISEEQVNNIYERCTRNVRGYRVTLS
ncbi:RNA silencing suppressor p21 [Soybean leaf crinkle mottle virus]|nr:RNA silencing suppressor p21 [Soybean leaf crinkle mottle virus]